MNLIQTATDAETAFVLPDGIDWKKVDHLQVWSFPDGVSVVPDQPEGIRYGVIVVFNVESWLWTKLSTSIDDVTQAVQRLSATHDKPICRFGDDDEHLKAAGY